MKTWTPEHDAEQRATKTAGPGGCEGDDAISEVVLDASTKRAPQSPIAGVGSSAPDAPTADGAMITDDALENEGNADCPLRSDPKFERYFRMLDKGLPEGAVRNALQRDGLDASILDMDPSKSYASQTAASQGPGPADVPLKDDPRFEKYFRMLDKGLPEGAVRNALQRDGVEIAILDMDPNKSLVSQTGVATPELQVQDTGGGAPALKDDPRFEKYFRMLTKGLPEGAVRNALQRDGVEIAILDLDPNRSLESQTGVATPVAQETDGGAPALKDDPRFEKYFRMLDKGLPEGAVRNALLRDGVGIAIVDLDPNRSLESQTGATPDVQETGGGAPALKDDPRFEKYFRMLAKGLSAGAVRNALLRDGVEIAILELDPNKSLDSQTGAAPAVQGTPEGALVVSEKSRSEITSKGRGGEELVLKNDPTYEKYFRMIEKGLPMGAVRNALQRDGLDASVLDLDVNRSLASQSSPPSATPTKDAGIPLCEDPDWKKYFTMLKMGLPLGAVKNAVIRDGKDPAFMDLDPNKSIEFQLQSIGIKLPTSAKKKKRVRRKKIYWTPIDPGQVKEDSLWSIVRGKVQMSRLKYDIQEFEDLFTESADPGDQNRKKASVAVKKVKKSVQVIDGKRSMNGGIILLRLKMDYKVIAKMVDEMYVQILYITICSLLDLVAHFSFLTGKLEI
jgi:Formin Homology 2 Domain/Subunit CCDC53 of WASH complex